MKFWGFFRSGNKRSNHDSEGGSLAACEQSAKAQRGGNAESKEVSAVNRVLKEIWLYIIHDHNILPWQ